MTHQEAHPMNYEYNERGEITNVKPEIDTKDFRSYPTETVVTRKGETIKFHTCCELVGGRWEYFISEV